MRAGARRIIGVLAVAATLVMATMGTTAQAGPPPPLNVIPPTITGVPLTGQTLTAGNGWWTMGGAPLLYAYEWKRCDNQGNNCVSTGVTTKTYVVRAADVGHTLRVTVACTGDNGNGSTRYATSPQTAPVAA